MIEKVLPARFASALMNGDVTSDDLSDDDLEIIDNIIYNFGTPLDISQDTWTDINDYTDTEELVCLYTFNTP